jgi:PAS domain S-box-containing protein
MLECELVIDPAEYTLETLCQDGEFILYRGLRKNQRDASPSSILVSTPVTERPAPGTLRKIEHAFSLKAELDPRWAVRPLALTQHQGRSMLLLEDPGGEPLDGLITGPMELRQFLSVAIGLSAAIGRLHGRGLIHKDIKPAHVFVDVSGGKIRLMGFGISSRLPRERQAPEPPEVIAGSLAYMAPEQTGRMNRSIDSRSDLYALGVTLYQVLTGSLPFTASDPMEWVHCHIARQPVPPSERLEKIPAPVSHLIMKLLAKTAEERYQTAAGVESDLRRCLAEWELHGSIDPFTLGEHDTPDWLLIPEKLYGRAREVETLLASFDRIVKSGRSELVLVSGYSGIGKSAVVNELHKPLVPPRGLFASGKFDQYKRDIPYATLAQAFESLIRPLLSKTEAELRVWRDALLEALGQNGRLMVDLVPELKLIIGEPPPVPELPPQDAQRRFQLVFRRFIGVFARPEHPLALFLDDLQWLDAATLDLLEDMLTRSDLQHLMLIGAYRDNEVTVVHPLMRKLEIIKNAGGKVAEITLAPLAREHLGQLIADALRCDPEQAAPLAQLVHEKTCGNPFFAVQFISSLGEEGLLTFDHDIARWSWDLKRIHAKGYTDNVVDLMVGKLTRLPAETQNALQQLACLGNIAEITTVAIVLGVSEEQVHTALSPAVRQDLVERLAGSYRFIHDRVQEAAYSLVPEELRDQAHLRIGRLLATHIPPNKRDDAIFEIVNQLNRGASMIASHEERKQLAELNLAAGKRAKASSAYASALTYLTTGAGLLPEGSWERRQELEFEFELHSADCEVCMGALQEAGERLAALATRAVDVVQRCAVARRRVELHTMLGACESAIDVGLECLRHVGINWPVNPTREEVRVEYDRIWSTLGSGAIEDLIDLPLMQDAEALATLDVLAVLTLPAMYNNENLHALNVSRTVNLSLERGNSDAAPGAYAAMGLIAGARFGHHEEGYRLAKMACHLIERRGLKHYGAKTYFNFAVLVPWTRPLKDAIDPVRRALQMATEQGQPASAAHDCRVLISLLLALGHPLDQVERQAEDALEFILPFGSFLDRISAPLALVRSLRGKNTKFGSLDDGQFMESSFEQRITGHPNFALRECYYWIRKLQARFFASDYASAVDAANRAERWYATSVVLPLFLVEMADCCFFAALARAACCAPLGPDPYAKHREALQRHHQDLRAWAEKCPQNFEDRATLVGAEIARIEGRPLDAMDLYERAIVSARANGFVQNEALAYELAARFYAARGFHKFADAYLLEARYCYQRWGADGKVRQLDQLYPHLREQEPVPGPTSTIGASVEQLDLATVIKVSQAVSGEMVLEKLIDTLMRTAIEHAGAARGLLMLPRGDELRIAAEATTVGDTVIVGPREASVAALPESIIHYVVRTRESVLLDDASAENPFAADPYVRQHHARSLLCMPLMNRATLIGVLYLENNLTPHVFTPARIAVLKLLASQAAISLENARLYRDAQHMEAYLKAAQTLSHTGSFGWRPATGEIVWSEETYHITGYDRGTKPTLDLVLQRIHPEDTVFVQEALDRGTRNGTDLDFEHRLLLPDGSVKYVHIVGYAVRDESRNIEYVGAIMDITARKQAEEALRKSQGELAHIARVMTMGELVASIAHEVNQPLAAVVNSAGACVRWLDAQKLEEARRSASRAMAEGHRASEIIGRIRALAQNTPPQKDWLDVNEAIHEVIALARSEIQRSGVALETQLSEHVPVVLADRIQLQQVLLNLIMNGIEAMRGVSAGPRVLEVSSERGAATEVVIAVRDSGPGFDPQSRERLFDAFYTTKAHGLGLGLAISRRIIEAHGGRLWATANTPRGAVVQFTVPLGSEGEHDGHRGPGLRRR